MFDDVNMVRWMLGVLSLVLMFGGLILILKRYQQTGGKWGQLAPFGPLGARPESRLKVTESMMVDARRKLVMVEDGVEEHLILLGTTQELLVSSRPIGAKPKSKTTQTQKKS